MPTYLYQAAYTSQAWAGQVKKPADRLAAVGKMIKDSGGKVVSSYYAFGPHDVVIIAEMPDNTAAASFAIAVAAAGAVSHLRTTPLMTAAEGLKAIRAAGKSAYKPPK